MLLNIKNKYLEILTALILMFGNSILGYLSDLSYQFLKSIFKFSDSFASSYSLVTFIILSILFLVCNGYVSFSYIYHDMKNNNRLTTPIYRKVLAGISIIMFFHILVIYCWFTSDLSM